jgi:hypothetical protein
MSASLARRQRRAAAARRPHRIDVRTATDRQLLAHLGAARDALDVARGRLALKGHAPESVACIISFADEAVGALVAALAGIDAGALLAEAARTESIPFVIGCWALPDACRVVECLGLPHMADAMASPLADGRSFVALLADSGAALMWLAAPELPFTSAGGMA